MRAIIYPALRADNRVTTVFLDLSPETEAEERLLKIIGYGAIAAGPVVKAGGKLITVVLVCDVSRAAARLEPPAREEVKS